MKRKTSARIQAALTAQRARLEAHRAAETARDIRRCKTATRRLRVIVGTTRPIVGGALVPLQGELRWLASVLGPVRDLDVLLDHLRPQVETLDDDVDGAKLVVAALERQRLFRLEEAREALASRRYDALLASIAAAGDAVAEIGGSLAPLASSELARLRAAAATHNGASSDVEIEVLRLRAERARFTAELVGGARWDRVARSLARVQDLGATYHDAVQAEERLRSVGRPKNAVAVGRLIERERFRKGAQRSALPAALAKALRQRG